MNLTYLMIRKDQRICQDNIFRSPHSKYDNLGNVIWGQGCAACIHGICFAFVTTESDYRELLVPISKILYRGFDNREVKEKMITDSFHLPRIQSNHPDSCRNQLFPQCIRECPDSSSRTCTNRPKISEVLQKSFLHRK